MQELRERYKNPIVWVPVFLSLLWIMPSVVMPYVTINVKTVTISDAENALEAVVTVDRKTVFNFPGKYMVSFRDAETDVLACDPIRSDEIDYVGGLTASISKPLSWWAVNNEQLKSCIDHGLRSGTFYAVTCHDWLLRHLPFARRCVRSNNFTLKD